MDRFYMAYLEASDKNRQAQALARLAARAITVSDCIEHWLKAALRRVTMRHGDIIQHRGARWQTWKVMAIATDGTLRVQCPATGRRRKILRPELYKVVHSSSDHNIKPAEKVQNAKAGR